MITTFYRRGAAAPGESGIEPALRHLAQTGAHTAPQSDAEEFWELAALRRDAAKALIDGHIIVGDEELKALIPHTAERVWWQWIHGRAATGLPVETFVAFSDGSSATERLYFPSLVQEYLREAGRLAARADAELEQRKARDAKRSLVAAVRRWLRRAP